MPFQKSHQGFTLMEMLVVITIFSITVSIVIELFVLMNRLQRRLTENQKLISDTRFVFERITRNVRSGTIDYEYYKKSGIDITTKTYILSVRDQENNQIVFRRNENGAGKNIELCAMDFSTSNQDACSPTSDPANWKTLFTLDVAVEDFSLFIAPSLSPFTLRSDNSGLYEGGNVQPRVTMILRAVNQISNPTVPIHRTYLQTTVTTRMYRR